MEKKILLKILEYYNIVFFIAFTWNSVKNYRNILIVITIFVMIFNLIILLTQKNSIIKIMKQKKLCMIIAILLLLSTIYSINSSNTLEKAIELLFVTIYIYFLNLIYSKKEFYSILRKYFLVTIVFSLVLVVIKPSTGMMQYEGQSVIRGVYGHKNILARNMIIAFIILINDAINTQKVCKKVVYYFFSVLCILLIILSKSLTGLLLLFMVSFINHCLIKNNNLDKTFIKIINCIIIMFNILIIFIANPKFSDILQKIYIMGKNLTFTGRSGIWNFSINAIINKPILGYGYDAFWNNSTVTESFYNIYWFNSPHSHNGYLNLLLDGGIVLLLLVLFIIIRSVYNNIGKCSTYLNRDIFILSVLILVVNLIESAFLDNTNYIFWMIICFNYLSIDKTKEEYIF